MMAGLSKKLLEFIMKKHLSIAIAAATFTLATTSVDGGIRDGLPAG